MRNGLYGKLPCKRDFVAEGVPRGFLPVFEPWLQGSLGAARMALGSRWQEIYLSAPIWRFWIGSAHCGRTVTGAFMPSVDGVGRWFPLTLMAAADEGETIAPPTASANETWFDAVETLLLSALDDGRRWEDLTADLAGLSTPPTAAPTRLPDGAVLTGDGLLVARGGEATTASAFAALAGAGAAAELATATFWWTIGGGTFPAMAATSRRMPDQGLFQGFLTGRFEG